MQCVEIDGKPVIEIHPDDGIMQGGKPVSHDARIRLVHFAREHGAFEGKEEGQDTAIRFKLSGSPKPETTTSRMMIKQLAGHRIR